MPKIHLKKEGYNCNMTICGRVVYDNSITEDKTKVTCGICKISLGFISQIPGFMFWR